MTSEPLRQVFEAARGLSEIEQAELVDLLLTSAQPNSEWETEWVEEAEARLAEYERGQTVAIDAEEAIAEGRRRLAPMRSSP